MNLFFITGSGLMIIFLFIIAFIVISFFLSFFPIGLWISAIAAEVNVGIFSLVEMRLRRIKPKKVIDQMNKAHKAGIKVSTNQLESHYLAGGNVDRVVDALIAEQPANINLTF